MTARSTIAGRPSVSDSPAQARTGRGKTQLLYRHCEEAEGRRGNPEAARKASGLLRYARKDEEGFEGNLTFYCWKGVSIGQKLKGQLYDRANAHPF